MRALLFLLEIASRLSLVAALLAVSTDSHLAAGIAVGASIAAGLRAFVRGELVMRELVLGWRGLVGGVRARSVSELAAYREDRDGVAMMIDAVREVALVRATSVAEIAAHLVSLALVSVLVVVRLSITWLALGVGLAALLAVVVRLTQRRQSQAQARAYRTLGGMARDARALVEAAGELRPMGREDPLAARIDEGAVSMAVDERDALRLGAAMGLGPSVVALGALVVPASVVDVLSHHARLVDLGVLGGSAIAIALSLVHALESYARSAPYRATFERIARLPPPATPPAPIERFDAIAVRELSVVHEGATRATPDGLSFSLASGGVALVGPNGAGKTSALLALLGAVAPARGEVLVDGRAIARGSPSLGKRVSFLPQRPFVSAGESLRWHARLVLDDEEALRRQLARVGLDRALAGRARGGDWLELPMGTLSGGERQRFFVARTLAREARLVVLDEPEASLDASARADLRSWLEEAAQDRLVLVVAHDPAAVPDAFARVECRATSPKPSES